MLKNKRLKGIIILFIMIIASLCSSINCLAYQNQNDREKINCEQMGGIIEANLETGEIQEKTYQEVFANLRTTYNQITHTEPYYPTNDNEISPNVIIGDSDDREPASIAQICVIEITWNDGCTSYGTAFMIGPNLAATSGHCVYQYHARTNHDAHGLAKSIRVIPGKSGSSEPYGSAYATSVVYENNWRDYGDIKEDWGLLILNSNIGNSCGYMGFAYSNDYSWWNNKYVTVTGYPTPPLRGWTQWTHREQVKYGRDLYMIYAVDTESGQSGSPVIEDGTGYAIGIHHGEDTIEGTGYNLGINITKARFNTFLSYR